MEDSFTKTLKALADPSRRKIFHTLIVLASAIPITQVVSEFEISRQGVTKHLKVLEDAGLVHIKTQGRQRYCKADAKPLQEMNKWLQFYDKFWDDSLNSLTDYLGNKDV
ncbi:MAG: transcriptional regulator [Bacteroidetes bacterium]|nr:MAG: transcriptional regulator [Bacteroidota bacterium]